MTFRCPFCAKAMVKATGERELEFFRRFGYLVTIVTDSGLTAKKITSFVECKPCRRSLTTYER